MSAHQLVQTYLDQLEGSQSTVRQRRWALRDLLAYAGSQHGPALMSAPSLLEPDLLTAWVARAQNDPVAPASQAGLRARAGAARALDCFARAQHLLGPGEATPSADLTLAAPPNPAETDLASARYLLTVAAGVAPWPVHPGVWARFAAHAHLSAATGAGETALAGMTTGDLADAGGSSTALSDRSRLTVERWLEVRAGLVDELQGSDPAALWLRVHPSTNRRTGQVAAAGLAITARGLRLAFTHMVAAAAGVDARVASVRPRDLRALGREIA